MQSQHSKNGKGPLVPYIRQSRFKERTISLDDQRRAIEGWAKTNGVELAEPIVEQGVSGSKSWRERELGQAIDACENGTVAGVIVAFQDRLSREHGLATAEVWQALEAAQARLVCAAEGLDTATGDHEMLFSIKAAIAREQWKRHKLNWENGRRNAIERGVHTSTIPTGYTPSVIDHDRDGKPIHGPLEPNEHAPAVLAAFEARAKGASWTQVARLLTDLNVPTGRDRRRNDGELTPWTFKSAAVTLANPVYIGTIKSGEFVKADAHEPIVDAILWRRVRARDEQAGSWSKTKREPAMLAKVLRCAACGGAMTRDSSTRPDGSRHSFYRCKAVGVCSERPTISLPLVEKYVSEWVIEAMRVTVHRPPKHGKNRDARRADLEAALTAAESELETYVTATSAADIGAELFAKGLAQRKQTRDEAVTALQEIEDDEDAFQGLPPLRYKGRRGPEALRAFETIPIEIRNSMIRHHFPNGIPVKRGHGVAEKIGDLDAFALREEVAA